MDILSIVPFILFCIGLVGNSLCLIVFSRKKFKLMSLNLIFRLMAITNTLALSSIPIGYLVGYNSNEIACILFKYFTYSLYPIKGKVHSFELFKIYYIMIILHRIGWFLVYIAIERFLTIHYPIRNKRFKGSWFQLLVAFLIISFNFLYYLPIMYSSDILYNITTLTNETVSVCYLKKNATTIIKMDMLNNAFVPFFLMLLFSLLMTRSLFKLRNRVNISPQRRKSKIKDLRFSITTISLNFLYFFFKLPFAITNALWLLGLYVKDKDFPKYYIGYEIAKFLSNLMYSMTIFVYLAFNPLFRHEFFLMLSIKKNANKEMVNS